MPFLNKKNRWHFFIRLLAVLFSAACTPLVSAPPADTGADSVTVARQPAPSATPTARPTVMLTLSPKPLPTASPTSSPTPTVAPLTPQPILEIPLDGPAASRRAEFSGMAWYGDYLVLLPQYPRRFGSGDGVLFLLDRAEIESFVDGAISGPLTPRPLPVDAPGLRAAFPGYEGFESIVFDGDRVYLTVEASPAGGMVGWIVTGQIEPDLSVLHIDVASAVAITPQAKLGNMSDEAIVLVGSGDDASLLTIYEANGRLVNPAPVAHRFAADLAPLRPLPFPPVEYRITDATPVDGNGRFWAINYFYPGDVKLKPGRDSLLRLFARNLPQVERLVEFHVAEDRFRFSGAPPVYLELLDADARNWEGIARLGDQGFLLVTDYHPRTILAFVDHP